MIILIYLINLYLDLWYRNVQKFNTTEEIFKFQNIFLTNLQLVDAHLVTKNLLRVLDVFDFCNFLLAGTSVSNLARLQHVQNTLARVVAQKPRFCHITPVLSDLHWLSVRLRISFEIAMVTYRVLQFQQPSYLASLIPRYVPARALRSCSSLSICVPTCKTTMAASKSFSSVASGIWNALPNHLSSVPTLPVFRRALKLHLFLLAYPDSSAKSGMIKPAQCISLRDTVPTTAIAQPVNTMPPI